MPVQIVANDEATQYLNAPAVAELQLAATQYVQDVLREASRLEAAGKSTKGNPEVTSSMIRDADMLLRRAYTKPKKDPVIISAHLLSTVGGFLVGFFTDAEKLKNPGTFILFVVILAVTITAAVVGVLKE
jgi:hypothetical protein